MLADGLIEERIWQTFALTLLFFLKKIISLLKIGTDKFFGNKYKALSLLETKE